MRSENPYEAPRAPPEHVTRTSESGRIRLVVGVQALAGAAVLFPFVVFAWFHKNGTISVEAGEAILVFVVLTVLAMLLVLSWCYWR